jgi:hypothetical protein
MHSNMNHLSSRENQWMRGWGVFVFPSVIALSILGCNLGYSEYLSVPIFFLAVYLYISLSGNQWNFLRLNILVPTVIGLMLSIWPVYDFIFSQNDWHSALFQLRELFFLIVLVVVSSSHSRDYAANALLGFKIASVAVACYCLLQSVEISLLGSITLLPHSWMMLDYGNSLQNALLQDFDYLRPVAFYSEPSVVSSVLIPAYYLALKSRDKIWVAVCLLGVLAAKSLLGIVGFVVVSFFFSNKSLSFRLVFLLLLLLVFGYYFGERIQRVISGEDLSAQWRIFMPLDFLGDRLHVHPWSPLSSEYISYIQEFFFDGASITDTWLIFTVLRLGFFGFIWIIFCFLFCPKNCRFVFLFMTLISGAPLYHDKVLIIALYSLAKKVFDRD